MWILGLKGLTNIFRVVTKISSCQVYVISLWENEQLGNYFGSVFLLFPMKVGGSHGVQRK